MLLTRTNSSLSRRKCLTPRDHRKFIHPHSNGTIDASCQTCLWCYSHLLEGAFKIPSFAIYGLSISFFGLHSLLLVMLMIVFAPLLQGWDSEPFFGITIQTIGRLEKLLVSLLRQWTPCIRSWLMMLTKANLIP